MLLALLTLWIARKFKWDAFFRSLALIYATESSVIFAGPDYDIWHHDLVATGVVAARLGLIFIVDFALASCWFRSLLRGFIAMPIGRAARTSGVAGLRSTHFRAALARIVGAPISHGGRSDHHDFVAADSAPGRARMGTHIRGAT